MPHEDVIMGTRREVEETKSLKRGGKGRDGCSPEICVDILSEVYLVVLSVCL